MTGKMLKHFIHIIFLFSIISCINRSNSKIVRSEKLVPDSLICATINCFINDTTIPELKFSDRFIDKSKFKVLSEEDSLLILKLDSIFSKEDLNFIFKQNNNSLNFNLKEFVRNKVLIPYDTISKFNPDDFWNDYHKKFGNKGFCSISLPLFSKDFTTAIIKYSIHCGRLNGGGGTFIFKKIGSNWIKVMCLDGWIS
jgi:hypothetical protein